MNELLNALRIQAGMIPNGYANADLVMTWAESRDNPGGLNRFAQLIIKECIDACYKANEIRNIVPPSQDQVVLWCIEEIERKFGVK